MSYYSDPLVVVTSSPVRKKSLGPSLGSVEKNDGSVMSTMDAEWENFGIPGIYHS